jgi:hypothetical protein
MTSRSRLVSAFTVIAGILLAGCGVADPATPRVAARRGVGAAPVSHVRAVEAVISRKASVVAERVHPRQRAVESLIVLADLAGRNDWRRFNRAIADSRRAIQRYRQSIGGDVAALFDVDNLSQTIDHVIALASYTGTEPDIDLETDAGEGAETDAVVYLGSGVSVPALTNAVTDSIAAAARTSLPVENVPR